MSNWRWRCRQFLWPSLQTRPLNSNKVFQKYQVCTYYSPPILFPFRYPFESVPCYAQCGDNFCTGPSITTTPPPYTSRFQNFSFTCTWDFCKKNHSEKSDMYNFLCFCKSHQFFTISQRLLWYLTYLLPMSFTKGPKPFYIFFSKQFLSNFVSVV